MDKCKRASVTPCESHLESHRQARPGRHLAHMRAAAAGSKDSMKSKLLKSASEAAAAAAGSSSDEDALLNDIWGGGGLTNQTSSRQAKKSICQCWRSFKRETNTRLRHTLFDSRSAQSQCCRRRRRRGRR